MTKETTNIKTSREETKEDTKTTNVFRYDVPKTTYTPTPTLNAPSPLPGDCDVKSFVLKNVKAYDGNESFLVGPTQRTLKALNEVNRLLAMERQNGGVLSIDTDVASTITSHSPGYLLSCTEDIIKGLQTDAPLKRSCKPKGGFSTVEKALTSYGYQPNDAMKRVYTEDVKTHNDLIFSMYTKEMRKARHVHLLTGLPDAYGRGRIIGDYRRIALYGVDELIRRKNDDFDAVEGSSLDAMRLRSEISGQIKALKDLLIMADGYGINLRVPATTFKEAAQVRRFL
jgi:formate C-acetyltransferase